MDVNYAAINLIKKRLHLVTILHRLHATVLNYE